MKKAVIFGAGLVSKPMVDYFDENGIITTIASRTLSKAQKLAEGKKNVTAVEFTIDNKDLLEKLVKEHDIAISLLPYIYHVEVAKACIENKKPMVTTSYVSQAMQDLDEAAKEAGIILLNEIGLDPGIDHMSAMKIIHEIEEKGGEIESFVSYCGGLPDPKNNDNPWGYKFSWSPRGVVLAGKNGFRYMKDGKIIEGKPEELFANPEKVDIKDLGIFEGYPNRDSVPYIEKYGLHKTKTMFRGTLRNEGWCNAWYNIGKLGFLTEEKYDGINKLTYKELLKQMVNCGDDNVKKCVADFLGIAEDSNTIKMYEWLGLFSDTKIDDHVDNKLDALSEILNKKLQYKSDERDMIVLYHQFIAKYGDRREKVDSLLVDFGKISENTAMARTVSLPAAIATKLILDGKINLKGVYIPTIPEIYIPVLSDLEKMGIAFKENSYNL